MSKLNVKRLVENIRSGTNVYTPLVELVVNAIQAIDEAGIANGLVQIEVIRSGSPDLDNRSEDVSGFIVKDNGIGFTNNNRDAFDLLYTERKAADGGKGFGRFTCLKYFDKVRVSSTFFDGTAYHDRSFKMGLADEIIIDETITPSRLRKTGTAVEISDIKSIKFPDKGLETISRVLVERLLPYFVDNERCPRIVITDFHDQSNRVSLNDYLGRENSQIVEMVSSSKDFTLSSGEDRKTFEVRVFKFFFPRTAKSKITLVAHRREVTDNPIDRYIPEFAEEFYEAAPDKTKGRNFLIKAYVFGEYLNDNVSLERGEFRFQTDNDLLNGISQTQIEQRAADIAQTSVGDEVAERRQRKRARITDYVEKHAPWHRILSNEIDFGTLAMNPSHMDMELYFQKAKYEKEVSTRGCVAEIMRSNNPDELAEKIAHIVGSISDTSKNDLIHYVSLRKCVLDLLSKSLEVGPDGKYKSEGVVHDIIMRRWKDTDNLDYSKHNLWILDERLNFSTYVTSDIPFNPRGDKADLVVYNNKIVFRGENVASNPITIFEFKKPQRDDFVNPSSDEDPVQQIIRYANQIREGKYKTHLGRDINVAENTPFYGYVICDITHKMAKWLKLEKDFKPLPDGQGWFHPFGNNNLYMEVLSWTKLLNDAEMRNKIFFQHLGIN